MREHSHRTVLLFFYKATKTVGQNLKSPPRDSYRSQTEQHNICKTPTTPQGLLVLKKKRREIKD